MPATSERGKSGRSGSGARGRSTSASGGSRASSASRQRPTRTAKSGGSNGGEPDAAKSATSQAAGKAGRNGSGSEEQSGGLSPVIPLASAAIGVAGGVLLGRNGRKKTRKVLGMEVPSTIDFSNISEQGGEAAKQ